jgi:beta-N-acetylhexosaminidase
MALTAACGGSDTSDSSGDSSVASAVVETDVESPDDTATDDTTDDTVGAEPAAEGSADREVADEDESGSGGTDSGNQTTDNSDQQPRGGNANTSEVADTAGVTEAVASRMAGARVLCSFTEPAVPQSVLDAIRDGRASGVLLFADNVPSQDQAVANGDAIREAAEASPTGAPAIVAIDQEGGIVKRIPGSPSASAAEMGAWSNDEIRAEARATGELMRAWGANLDLAPVADVARPGGFIDRQNRSFGSDLAIAADGVVAFTEGLRLAGVGSTLKHFPGLGSATLNTDDSVSVVETAPGDLWSIDFIPFAAGINVGADVVMMSSAAYPAVDDRPAVFSEVWVNDVLRGELGFGGVVVSDALDTPALAAAGGVGARAVEAAKAGVDLFIASSPGACEGIHSALTDAIRSGELDEDASNASVRRIDALRRSLG